MTDCRDGYVTRTGECSVCGACHCYAGDDDEEEPRVAVNQHVPIRDPLTGETVYRLRTDDDPPPDVDPRDAELVALRAELAQLKARPATVPADVRDAVNALQRWCHKDGWSEFVEAEIDIIDAWLDTGALWAPIATAPKNGTSVLLASRLPNRPSFVETGKWDATDKKWVSWYGTQIVQPYAWQPKPEAPEGDL